MKQQLSSQDVNGINESMIDELYTVQSLVQATLESCLTKECESQYYEGKDTTCKISEERNNYINMLGVALEKIKHIQTLNGEIEDLIIESNLSSIDTKKKK